MQLAPRGMRWTRRHCGYQVLEKWHQFGNLPGCCHLPQVLREVLKNISAHQPQLNDCCCMPYLVCSPQTA